MNDGGEVLRWLLEVEDAQASKQQQQRPETATAKLAAEAATSTTVAFLRTSKHGKVSRTLVWFQGVRETKNGGVWVAVSTTTLKWIPRWPTASFASRSSQRASGDGWGG